MGILFFSFNIFVAFQFVLLSRDLQRMSLGLLLKGRVRDYGDSQFQV